MKKLFIIILIIIFLFLIYSHNETIKGTKITNYLYKFNITKISLKIKYILIISLLIVNLKII